MTVPLSEQAGGAARLRAVLEDFYVRVFDDVMIGYLFRGQDRARLVARELELTLQLLGADVEYRGRPLRAAHRPHPILGGHFDRRLQILRETLADHGLPEEVQRAWIEHNQRMRAAITGDHDGECDDVGAARRLGAAGPDTGAGG